MDPLFYELGILRFHDINLYLMSKFAIRYRGVIIWNGIMKLGIDPDTSDTVFVKLFKNVL